jgi:hypothetical protein
MGFWETLKKKKNQFHPAPLFFSKQWYFWNYYLQLLKQLKTKGRILKSKAPSPEGQR